MNEIVISEVQIIPVKPRNGLVAFASCVIYNSFYLGNIAIYTSPSSCFGYRLVYPAKELPNGKQINCVHPINKNTGNIIESHIIKQYEKLMEKVVRRNEEIDTKP